MTDPRTLLAQVVERVPGYQEFLRREGADPTGPWEALPLTTKQNYLLAFPVEELCWDGSLASCHLIGCSSGFSQSGSIFWPKRPQDEADYLEGLTQVMTDHYHVDKKRTLVLVCLAFGTWIGGMQLASAMRVWAGRASHPITVSTPGLHLAEAAEICARFHGSFEQVLWITNPSNVPLITALLERKGVDLGQGRHHFGVVGEYYTESFREWVAERYGHPQDSPYCLWTGYGSADTGGLGVETARTVAARKWLQAHPERCQELFGTPAPPMLLELDPHAHIEVVGEELVVTKDQLIPLIRYNTRDAGGLLGGSAFPAELGLPENILYVQGRATDAIIFYGTNLLLSDLSNFLLGLPPEMSYGGLFQVRRRVRQGVTTFSVCVYIQGTRDEERRQGYREAVIGFFKSRSLEFATKFEALSGSFGEDLIQVELADAAELPARVKHRFLVDE